MNERIAWNNQACANCGVTAELHGSPDPPMLRIRECFQFVWGQKEYYDATPPIVRLEQRISSLEEEFRQWRRQSR